MPKKRIEVKKNTIEDAVMRHIAQKKVMIKPRWFFLLGSLLLSGGFLGISILALFLFNLSFFLLLSHGPRAEWRVQLMLEAFPWYIPVLGFFALIGGIWFLKKYDFSYKHNFKFISLGFIFTIIVFAILIYKTIINTFLFFQCL